MTNHLVYQKIICLLAKNYCWLKIKDKIYLHVSNKYTSRRGKAFRDYYISLLKLFLKSNLCWADITLDFVIEYLLSNNL